MLVFSAVLPVRSALTKDDFLRLVVEWNQTSPYAENVIPGLAWNGESHLRCGGEALWLAADELPGKNIVAVRYEKRTADGVVWDTDYVADFSRREVFVRLDRSYREDAVDIDAAFSTPYFITLLIDRGYLAPDGALPVGHTPIPAGAAQHSLLAGIFAGSTPHRLPVVYVSLRENGRSPMDVQKLAWRLKGVAHVFAAGSAEEDEALRAQLGEGWRPGTAGVHYPHETQAPRLFHYRAGIADRMTEHLIRTVIAYSTARQVDSLHTWPGAQSALLRAQLDSQSAARRAAETAQRAALDEARQMADAMDAERARMQREALSAAKSEADALLDSFDEEMRRLRERAEELTRLNERLLAENLRLQARLNAASAAPLLVRGHETDFYPGEVKDLILSTLSDSLPTLVPGSRRADAVRDILESNDFEALSARKADRLKNLLKGYTGMTAPLRKDLEDLGFVITAEQNHYKFTYFGDGRYMTVLAKTPSDKRAGKNTASDSARMVF